MRVEPQAAQRAGCCGASSSGAASSASSGAASDASRRSQSNRASTINDQQNSESKSDSKSDAKKEAEAQEAAHDEAWDRAIERTKKIGASARVSEPWQQPGYKGAYVSSLPRKQQAAIVAGATTACGVSMPLLRCSGRITLCLRSCYCHRGAQLYNIGYGQLSHVFPAVVCSAYAVVAVRLACTSRCTGAPTCQTRWSSAASEAVSAHSIPTVA